MLTSTSSNSTLNSQYLTVSVKTLIYSLKTAFKLTEEVRLESEETVGSVGVFVFCVVFEERAGTIS